VTQPAGRLRGRTLLAAVDRGAMVAELARAAEGAGSLLAVVCPDAAAVGAVNRVGSGSLVAFAADPADPAVWERVVAHVEQRLGPIDALLTACSPTAALVATAAVRADLQARGGPVVQVDPAADPVAGSRALLDGVVAPQSVLQAASSNGSSSARRPGSCSGEPPAAAT
jgi:hypothetical protein